MGLNFKEIGTITLILFAVIDIIGSLPVIVDIKAKTGHLSASRASIISGAIMIVFLFLGESLLNLIHLDIPSFALAGSIVIFLIGLEMIMGITLIKDDPNAVKASTVVPLAFPMIAGAGTLTTILSLKAEFANSNILVGILVNIIIVFIVLNFVPYLERLLGKGGLAVLRRIFGIILLAIAIKLFKTNLVL